MEKAAGFDLLWFATLAIVAMLSVVSVGMLREAPMYRMQFQGFSFARLYPIDASFLFTLVWSLFLVVAFLLCFAYSRDLTSAKSDAESREAEVKLARRLFAKIAVSSLAAMLVAAFLADHIYQIQFFNSFLFYGLLGVYAITIGGIYMLYKYLLDVARGRWS
jgi:magnesium-transporting ATPase (P-type)